MILWQQARPPPATLPEQHHRCISPAAPAAAAAQAVTRLASAFATSGHKNPQLFAAVAAYMAPAVKALPAAELRSLGHSFAALGYAGGERFTRAADGLEHGCTKTAGVYLAGLAGGRLGGLAGWLAGWCGGGGVGGWGGGPGGASWSVGWGAG